MVERIEGEWPLPQLSEGATTTWTAPSLEADHPATALVHIPQVGWQSVPVVPRANLQPGQSLVGPVLIPEATGCTVLEPGWTAAVDGLGNLLLEHQTSVALPKPQALASASADPVELGLFHHRFMAIAERMGERYAHQPFGEHPDDFSAPCLIARRLGGCTPTSRCISARWGRWWRICSARSAGASSS